MSVLSVLIGFAAMMGLLLLSFPIAVIMVVIGVIGGLMLFGWPLVESMGPVIWGVQNENILTAIPLFILLGELLLRSGLADKMYGALALWLGRLPGGLLHTKSITVDGEFCLFGSVNLDMRSLWLNFEISLLIYNRDVTKQIRELQSGYIDNSNLLDVSEWKQRTFGRRLLENVTHLAAPLL